MGELYVKDFPYAKTRNLSSIDTRYEFLLVMILVAMFPAHALGTPRTVGTQEELEAAVVTAPEGQETEVSLSGNIPVAKSLVIPKGKQVKLVRAISDTAASSMSYILSAGKDGSLIVTGGITLDGAGESFYIHSQGALKIERVAFRK